MFSIGEKDYACSGMPDGVKCMSAREVYEATNNGQTLQSRTEKGEPVVGTHNGSMVARDAVIDNYVTPNLPDKPVPVRTPSMVMRIWVAPWEDKRGDLITPGYIYTEIEPRRWVIGRPNESSRSTFTPLD